MFGLQAKRGRFVLKGGLENATKLKCVKGVEVLVDGARNTSNIRVESSGVNRLAFYCSGAMPAAR